MEIIMLPVTLVTAGGAALIALWLGLRAGRARLGAKVNIGDGGNAALIARMRAQSNYVEYAPFIVILIALIEYTSGTSLWLWIASALFLIARVAHAFGMDGVKYCRTFGIAVTFALLFGLGVYAVALPLLEHYETKAADPMETIVPAG